MIINLVVAIKSQLYKTSYFPEPYTRSKNKIKVELDFYIHATKSHSKNAAGDDTSTFAKNADSASLKSSIDKLYTDTFSNVKQVIQTQIS